MPPSYDKLASASAIYAYANNDPVNQSDPNGHSWADLYDALGLAGNGVSYNGPAAPPISETPLGQYGPTALGVAADFTPVVGDIKGFYEAETPADYLIAAVTLIPGTDGLKFIKRIPGTAGKLATELGARFEKAVGKRFNIGQKDSYFINGRTRIADGINDVTKTVTEVKFVAHQGYTKQLKDMVAFAKQAGLTARVILPKGAYASRALRKAEKNGDIKILYSRSRTNSSLSCRGQEC